MTALKWAFLKGSRRHWNEEDMFRMTKHDASWWRKLNSRVVLYDDPPLEIVEATLLGKVVETNHGSGEPEFRWYKILP